MARIENTELLNAINYNGEDISFEEVSRRESRIESMTLQKSVEVLAAEGNLIDVAVLLRKANASTLADSPLFQSWAGEQMYIALDTAAQIGLTEGLRMLQNPNPQTRGGAGRLIYVAGQRIMNAERIRSAIGFPRPQISGSQGTPPKG